MNTFYTKLPFLVNTYQKFWSISTDARLFMIKTTIHVFNYNIHVARTSIANPQGLGEDRSFARGLRRPTCTCISGCYDVFLQLESFFYLIFMLFHQYFIVIKVMTRERRRALLKMEEWKEGRGGLREYVCSSPFGYHINILRTVPPHFVSCDKLNLYCHEEFIWWRGNFYCRLVYNYRLSTLYSCTF